MFLAGVVSAQVNYQIESDESSVYKNTTALLSCDEGSTDCPVNSWTLQWTVPENAEILRINDTQGEIEDYTRTGDSIRIETNTGPRRTTEKIQINTEVELSAEELAPGLYTREISLSGFPGEETQGRAEVDNLQSTRISEGFTRSHGSNSAVFEGEGAGSIKLNFGEGDDSRFYSFFGGGEDNGSLAYRVAVGTTGLRQSYDRIPVAVLPDERYEDEVAPWSQGEYTGGVITLRKALGEDFQPVLAEETVHAFNDEALDFDRTSSSWLDEGIAGYAQSMVRKKLVGPEKTRSVFGDDTVYFTERNGSRYRIEKPSSGNRNVLWNYYQENRSFMQKWNPSEVEADVRSFGYAYSELIVRNYVSNNNSVNDLYREIETEEPLTSNNEKWTHYGNHLDLTPCRFDDRERFDQCLDRVNNYDYSVLSASKVPEQQGEEISIEELETPNYTEKGLNALDSGFRNQDLFEESWANSLREFVQGIVDGLKQFSF
ncbi:hypothetical protein LC1Nh_0377 [Candidatus Nanohalobium constans]|uniref:Uncharacterized protein n=1 Tax=Candidatus Nanohalobium constans TaxID=2565781 RepID=A0A5Q0UFC0_9ARCH|nr:hypothetical protein LC1Nh_0377 [Candidatus Nanohalobium constans]